MGKVYSKIYPKIYPKIYGKIGTSASLESVLALGPAAMYDMSVLSSLYQDSAKTTPVVESGNPVGAVEDLTGNLPDMLQATSTKKAVYLSTAGRLLAFDGIDDFFTIATTSGFNFLHNGTGGEAFFAVRIGISADPNDIYTIIANIFSAGQTGIGIRYDDRAASSQNENMWCSIFNVAPTVPLEINTDNTSASITPLVHRYVCDDSASSDMQLYKDGVLVGSANKVSALPSGNASNNLYIGDTATNTQPFLGRIYALVFFDRSLSANEAEIVNSYLQSLLP